MSDAAADLYALDPADFVAARTKLSRELKAEGLRDESAAVAKLRKPSVVEHLLNRVAREEPELVRGWASAVVAAGDAQSAAIGGGDAASLREATAALRSVTGAVVDAAVELLGDEAKRGDVITELRRLTNAAGAAQLVAGTVGSGLAVDQDLFAGAPEPAPRTQQARSSSTKKGRRSSRSEQPDDEASADDANDEPAADSDRPTTATTTTTKDRSTTRAKDRPASRTTATDRATSKDRTTAEEPAAHEVEAAPDPKEVARRRRAEIEHRHALRAAQRAVERAERARALAAEELADAEEALRAAQEELATLEE